MSKGVFTYLCIWRSLSEHISEVVNFLSVDPLLGADYPIDDVCLKCMEQHCPLLVFGEVPCVANNNESVLGPCDGHIDAVVLLYEFSRFGADH